MVNEVKPAPRGSNLDVKPYFTYFLFFVHVLIPRVLSETFFIKRTIRTKKVCLANVLIVHFCSSIAHRPKNLFLNNY